MVKWNDHKIITYLPLMSTIKSRSWKVNIYAIKVGARGYCFRFLLCCSWNLGFNNILEKKPLKTVSKLSMESSFYIWLARDNVFCSPLNNTTPPESSIPSIPKVKIKNNLSDYPTPLKLPVGFINKGNMSC